MRKAEDGGEEEKGETECIVWTGHFSKTLIHSVVILTSDLKECVKENQHFYYLFGDYFI